MLNRLVRIVILTVLVFLGAGSLKEPAYGNAWSFVTYSNGAVGMFLGTKKCIIWPLTGIYKEEVACYDGGVLQSIQVNVGTNGFTGSFLANDGGSMAWIVQSFGAYQLGILDPLDGKGFKSGQF